MRQFIKKSLLYLCGTLIVGMAASVSAAEPVKIRAQILSNSNPFDVDDQAPVVGERVTLAVDVMTSSWFTRAPRFPHLNIRDAVNLKTSAFATNFSERIAGETYAVQRREYTIFPQRAGQFVIDGIEVTVWVANPDAGSADGGQKYQLRSDPLLFHVEALPEVEVLDNAVAYQGASLVAQSVELRESFSGDLTGLRVGDVIERQIQVSAQGTLGMLIPPLNWLPAADTRQSSLAPWVDDQTNRGEFIGLRRETRQYTLLKEGEVELPEIPLAWWDGDDWQLSRIEARVIAVESREGFDRYRERLQAVNAQFREDIPWENWLSLALIATPVLVGVLLLLRRATALLKLSWQAYRISEKRYWWRLLRATYWGSAESIQRHFYQWCRYSHQPSITVPKQWDEVWSQCYLLAQSGAKLSSLQRGELRSMCRCVRHSSLPAGRERGQSLSAAVSLQPLNPQD